MRQHFEAWKLRQRIRVGRVIWLSLWAAGLMVLGLALHAWFGLHPGPLFSHREDRPGFRVYAAEPIPRELTAAVERSVAVARRSELWHGSAHFDVVLCRGSLYSLLYPCDVLASAHHDNVVLAGSVDAEAGLLHNDLVAMHLEATLAHEMVHVLQFRRFGLLGLGNFGPGRIDDWKMEGYAEAISRTASQPSLGAAVDGPRAELEGLARAEQGVPGWIRLEDGTSTPLRYARSRIAVEHLLAAGADFAEIVADERSLEQVLSELP
jgi:hypothetical protein